MQPPLERGHERPLLRRSGGPAQQHQQGQMWNMWRRVHQEPYSPGRGKVSCATWLSEHYINPQFRYAHGIIARSYKPGSTVEIQLDLVAHHLVTKLSINPNNTLKTIIILLPGLLHIRHLSSQQHQNFP